MVIQDVLQSVDWQKTLQNLQFCVQFSMKKKSRKTFWCPRPKLKTILAFFAEEQKKQKTFAQILAQVVGLGQVNEGYIEGLVLFSAFHL